MKTTSRLVRAALVACALCLFTVGAYAWPWWWTANPWNSGRTIDPIVNTEWLAANRAAHDLVILDIRPYEAYKLSHIPGSVSEPFTVPFSVWITMRDELLLEVPPAEELYYTIGAAGISADTRVIVVSAPNPGEPASYGLSNATRVATTLVYAGIRNTAILDGGFPKWELEGLPTTSEIPTVTPVAYSGTTNPKLFVSREYVAHSIDRASIVDARDADVYFGVTTEPFADQAGHIKSASSLPAPWIWRADGTYLDAGTLGRMAAGVIQRPKDQDVVVYCGVGGYASAWWFVLTQVLGYRNVKLYDGGAQEWVRTDLLIPYRWE